MEPVPVITREEGVPTEIPLADLYIDHQNPRLTSFSVSTDQRELARLLWSEMAVAEVALSIAHNGYYLEERLLVVERDHRNGESERTYTVVEGNRRLAAVKVLVDDRLREAVKATDIPRISDEAKDKLQELPVLVYSDRKVLWSYIGFRHVNGTMEWDGFAKAHYVAQVHEEFAVDVNEIASRIGDQYQTVSRLYLGYRLLRQAEEVGIFNRDDSSRNRFYFSHLYTAADQVQFRSFLGITKSRLDVRDPVPSERLSHLDELLVWLYGSKARGKEPIVRVQNPDLNILRKVVASANALSALRSGYPLTVAMDVAIGDERRLRDSLNTAAEELKRANGTVTLGYQGEDDLLRLVEDVLKLAERIRQIMEETRTEIATKRRTSQLR